MKQELWFAGNHKQPCKAEFLIKFGEGLGINSSLIVKVFHIGDGENMGLTHPAFSENTEYEIMTQIYSSHLGKINKNNIIFKFFYAHDLELDSSYKVLQFSDFEEISVEDANRSIIVSFLRKLSKLD